MSKDCPTCHDSFFIPDVMGSKFSAGDQRATGVTIGHGHRLPYKVTVWIHITLTIRLLC
jgi:hypothetical protein